MQELETKKIISLMSGTSCDSIDVGLCEVMPDLTCKLIDGINVKYPEVVREKLFEIFEGRAGVKDICQMNFVVGKCFADAANELIKKWGKPDFIASHGQTVYHYPLEDRLDGISLKSTLQIGESSVIAQETGCMTISNFREADIAQGGQGAPLVCFADEKWGNKIMGGDVAIQNIGGISNVTVVSTNHATFGFDNGPGNVMIDYCCQKFFGMPYDKDGEIAASGMVSQSWLDCLLQDEYYLMPPPKTTGREYFSPQYIENALKIAPKEPIDIIATLTALTAKVIAESYDRFVYPNTNIKKVVIGGGGAYNPTLMKYLRMYLPKHIELKTHEDFGISNNFKEVMAFALLGYCTYYGIPNNLPACTGAKKRTVLGKITPFMNNKPINSSFGFTLAEVLITIGIIGVVAALTIPLLMNTASDIALKTALKKSYSTLQQALNQTISENGNVPYDCYYNSVTSYQYSDCDNFWQAYRGQLKVVNEYSGAVDGVNIPDYTGTDLIVALGGHNNGSFAGGTVALKNAKTAWTLADGSMLVSYRDVFASGNSGATLLIVDTNGMNGPNRWGYDIFMLGFLQKNSSNIILSDYYCGSQEKDGHNVNDILMNK